MKTLSTPFGYTQNGMPYNRYGRGSPPFVVFQGLLPEHKPLTGFLSGFFSGIYKFLEDSYTVYIVNRKQGLPDGYTMKNLSDDYADFIRAEFGVPVDVLGISTGGSIVQHFAADHPDLVRKLIIHSSAYTLTESANEMQLLAGRYARQGTWRGVYAIFLEDLLPGRGAMKYALKPAIWLGAALMGAFAAPKGSLDLAVTVEAESHHNFLDRLGQITAPTLVVAGEDDPFYTVKQFQDTAAGIPNGRLILYKGMGHPASGKQFGQDVLSFLSE